LYVPAQLHQSPEQTGVKELSQAVGAAVRPLEFKYNPEAEPAQSTGGAQGSSVHPLHPVQSQYSPSSGALYQWLTGMADLLLIPQAHLPGMLQ